MKGKVSLAVLALSLHGCSDDGPSGPSSPSPASSAGASPAAAGVALSGRVIDAVTGAPVGGASVEVQGFGPTSADSDGRFRIDVSASDARVVVAAPGYWTRETGMRPMGGSLPPATLSLLPDGNDFDLEFFDHVFRDVGEDGTHPWTAEPQFEIWEGVYECTGFVESAECDELTAKEERAPGMFVQMMRGVIQADAPRYTDGHVVGSNVITRSHPPGTVLPRSQYIEPGKITVALVSTRDDFSWGFWRYNSRGSMIGGHINLNIDHRSRRGVYSHELAHTLGFDHPLGLDRVPLGSIMRRGHADEPTRIDVLHARVLYGRPANNRTPDIDPAGYFVNGLRRSEAESGPEITRSAR
jgi:Carboxypeptidase regulatory-like domain